jgi:histidinol-phosphate aminotransferase
VAAIIDAASTVNRYPNFSSDPLIQALAERHSVPPECLALGTGSVAVLAQTIAAVAGAGDEVVVPWRSFEAYPILVQLSGARLVKVPLKPDLTHDLAAMARAVTADTRLLLVCTPNNPTGTIVTRSEVKELIASVPSDVLIAIDEAYVDFVPESHRLPTIELAQTHENVMVLRTFSKAYGLAGLRVGYAVAHPRIASALRKAQLPFGVSSLAERAALASLANERELLRRVEILTLERERVVTDLRAAGVEVTDCHGNFVWLPLQERASEFGRFLEERGVVARPFSGDGVRVTVAEPPANDAFVQAAIAFAQ